MREYTILDSGSTVDLMQQVRTKLAEGWTPLGGVAVLGESWMQRHLFQAMERSTEAKAGGPPRPPATPRTGG